MFTTMLPPFLYKHIQDSVNETNINKTFKCKHKFGAWEGYVPLDINCTVSVNDTTLKM